MISTNEDDYSAVPCPFGAQLLWWGEWHFRPLRHNGLEIHMNVTTHHSCTNKNILIGQTHNNTFLPCLTKFASKLNLSNFHPISTLICPSSASFPNYWITFSPTSSRLLCSCAHGLVVWGVGGVCAVSFIVRFQFGISTPVTKILNYQDD